MSTTKEYSPCNDDVEFASPSTPIRVGFGYNSLDERSLFDEENDECEDESTMQMIVTFFTRVPAIFISLLLVLFQTVSFGGIVFPGTWIWPSFIPHSLGFQIMLFATLVGQFFLTFSSGFDFAVALVMVGGVLLLHLQSITSLYIISTLIKLSNYV